MDASGLQVSQKVHCMVLNDEEESMDVDRTNKEKVGTGHHEEEEEEQGVVRLVSKVAGKKSSWKIVEKEFIQVCIVSHSVMYHKSRRSVS